MLFNAIYSSWVLELLCNYSKIIDMLMKAPESQQMRAQALRGLAVKHRQYVLKGQQ